MFNFQTSCSSVATASGDFEEGERSAAEFCSRPHETSCVSHPFVVLAVLAIPEASQAQVLYGSVNGTVTDQKRRRRAWRAY